MVKLKKIVDSTIVAQPSTKDSKSDSKTILNKGKEVALKVTIDATHSGVITNKPERLYPSLRMRDAYKTFITKDAGGTAEFNKPILKHHDAFDDAIGRVVGARYTPYKSGANLDFDFLSPEAPGSRGSGVITIDGIITDPDAIAKIIDGRYLSVSTSFTSPDYNCSICGDQAFSCDHYPGRAYNDDGDEVSSGGRLCFVIPGDMTYHEISFVNVPAQPPAKLLNFEWADFLNGNKDDNIVLSTYAQGKKDMVRTFSLCDSDGELSLLDGSYKELTKKTVISVNPKIADKLKHVVTSTTANTSSETSNVHDKDEGGPEGDTSAERDSTKADKTKKDQIMDPKELEALTKERDSLKAELAAAKTKVEELDRTVKSKDSEIERLTKDATASQEKMTKSLAMSLASLRVRLNKPGTEGLDSKEKLDSYVATLVTRSLESLQDSIADLVLELDAAPEVVKPESTNASKAISGKKVDSDVLHNGSKSKDKDTSNAKRRAPSAAAVLDKELGI